MDIRCYFLIKLVSKICVKVIPLNKNKILVLILNIVVFIGKYMWEIGYFCSRKIIKLLKSGKYYLRMREEY